MVSAGFGCETAFPGRTGTAIRSNPVTESARWPNKPTLHSLCIVPTVLPLAGDHDAQGKPLKDIGGAKGNPRADAVYGVLRVGSHHAKDLPPRNRRRGRD
jgi:hypothetical protein